MTKCNEAGRRLCQSWLHESKLFIADGLFTISYFFFNYCFVPSHLGIKNPNLSSINMILIDRNRKSSQRSYNR